jgi:hypothetical protein
MISVAIALVMGGALSAIAAPVQRSRHPADDGSTSVVVSEIDTSISRDYEPATIYIHDPITHQLLPHTYFVAADQPVVAAVEQIMQSYKGQTTEIQDYDVDVNPIAHEVAINFTVDHPRGARIFQSLSSASQYSLFEAIRETLLTEPAYDINEVIFEANGKSFEI